MGASRRLRYWECRWEKCILVDDILNTGQTLATAAEVLMKNGAQEVYACASHGLLSEGAKSNLRKCAN